MESKDRVRESTVLHGRAFHEEGSCRVGIGIGEMRNPPDYAMGLLQNFLRNRGGRGYDFVGRATPVLVGSASSNAVRGGVVEHDHDFWRRRRGYRESPGDMGRSLCSETEV